MTYDRNVMMVNVCGVEEQCGCKIPFQISVQYFVICCKGFFFFFFFYLSGSSTNPLIEHYVINKLTTSNLT